jgi:hypothetical protein
MRDRASDRAPLLRSLLAAGFGVSAIAISLGSALRPDAPAPPAVALLCDADTVVRIAGPERRIPSDVAACDALFLPPWAELPEASAPYQLALGTSSAAYIVPPRSRTSAGVELPGEISTVQISPIDAVDERTDDGGVIDLADRIRSMRVLVEAPDGSVRNCDRWLFGRWFCGPGDWNYVGASEVVVRTRAERCIWAHPTEEGVLVARIDGLPGGALLRGRMAFSDAAADNADGGPVQFRVHAWPTAGVPAPEPVLDREQANRRGWSSWRVNLPAGDNITVEFRVSAEDVGQRHFCFTASVRPQQPSEALEIDAVEGAEPGEIAVDGSAAPSPEGGTEGSTAVGDTTASDGSAPVVIEPGELRPAAARRARERVPGSMRPPRQTDEPPAPRSNP